MTDLHRPRTLAEATHLLGTHPGAVVVAGGTDLVLDRRTGRADPDALVDLSSLDPKLTAIVVEGEQCRIGAMTTIRTIERSDELAARGSALGEAARVLGSPQIRTMATIGGNVAHGTPSAEMPPPLLVHDAHVRTHDGTGGRTIPLGDLFTGPGATVLGRDEIIVEFGCEAPSSGWGSVYLRQTVRWAMDLAGVGVAAGVRVIDGEIATARIALGAVSPVPMRVESAEHAINGAFSTETTRHAGALAAEECSPIEDARGTVAYRRRVVEALVPRAVEIAWKRATGVFTERYAPINGVLPGGPG